MPGVRADATDQWMGYYVYSDRASLRPQIFAKRHEGCRVSITQGKWAPEVSKCEKVVKTRVQILDGACPRPDGEVYYTMVPWFDGPSFETQTFRIQEVGMLFVVLKRESDGEVVRIEDAPKALAKKLVIAIGAPLPRTQASVEHDPRCDFVISSAMTHGAGAAKPADTYNASDAKKPAAEPPPPPPPRPNRHGAKLPRRLPRRRLPRRRLPRRRLRGGGSGSGSCGGSCGGSGGGGALVLR